MNTAYGGNIRYYTSNDTYLYFCTTFADCAMDFYEIKNSARVFGFRCLKFTIEPKILNSVKVNTIALVHGGGC